MGIDVKCLSNGSMILSQSKYVTDLLERSQMTGCRAITTLIMSNCKLSFHGTDTLDDPHQYRLIVGALQHISLTRPNIDFSGNKVCQYLSAPLESHWSAVKRFPRYLNGISHLGLHLQPAQLDTPFSVHV